MARLYVIAESDRYKQTVPISANKELSFLVYYGSTRDSKLLSRIAIFYPKDTEKPTIQLSTEELIGNNVVNCEL